MEVRKRSWKGPDGKTKTSYFMDYVDPLTGRRRRETIPGVTSKETASKVAAARYRDICMKAGMGEAAGPTAAEKSLTLKQMLELDYCRNDAFESTIETQRKYGQMLMDIIGENKPVLEITNKVVDDFITVRKKQVSPRTVNLSLELLRAALKRARKLGRISRIPCEIETLPEPASKRRFLTPAEIQKMIDHEPPGNLQDFVVFVSALGLKPYETYRLKWSDIDFARKWIWVESRKRGGKGKMTREPMPMPKHIEKLLKRRLQESGGDSNALVFPERVGDRSVKRLARRAGIKHPDEVTNYTLRRSFATNLFASGASAKDAQMLMRHKDPALTLRIYAQESMPSMRVAIERIGSSKAQGRHKKNKPTKEKQSKAR